ncbi:tRNA1(Val) (adenine(37)-N6)-methyltransferase [Clostridiaceae bacterium M8S5]|nr:tRNA1(Val) (adenine(37)-N6)-methyltransferase [Clostridiaceae bacterium M8S5]
MQLYENERIDDLQLKGLKIIQNKEGFCFGMDAVLLANFTTFEMNSKCVDLGTGTGIIPLLLWGKRKPQSIQAVELQPKIAEMAHRTVVMNKLTEYIKIHNIDLKQAYTSLGMHKYDVVTSNPPYMPAGTGIINPNESKSISRHEVRCTIEDVVKSANNLLKNGGSFFMVHRPHRLVDIIEMLRKYKLEPKIIRFVHPKVGKKPNLLLIKSIKGAKPELRLLDPLYVYKDDGTYTEEIKDIYSSL